MSRSLLDETSGGGQGERAFQAKGTTAVELNEKREVCWGWETEIERDPA